MGLPALPSQLGKAAPDPVRCLRSGAMVFDPEKRYPGALYFAHDLRWYLDR